MWASICTLVPGPANVEGRPKRESRKDRADIFLWRRSGSGSVSRGNMCHEPWHEEAAPLELLWMMPFLFRSLSKKTTSRPASFPWVVMWWPENAATLRATPCVMSMCWNMLGSSSVRRSKYVPGDQYRNGEGVGREAQESLWKDFF